MGKLAPFFKPLSPIIPCISIQQLYRYPVLDNPELAFPEQAIPEQAIPEQDEPEQEKPVKLNIQESITESKIVLRTS